MHRQHVFLWVPFTAAWLTVLLAACTLAPQTTPSTETPPHQPPTATHPAEVTLTLEHTLWQMESYLHVDGYMVPALPQPPVFLTFENGVLKGDSGCNLFSAQYTLDGNRLALQMGPATLRGCDDEVGFQEASLFLLLPQVASYQIDGDMLVLMDEEGVFLLTAKPARR